MAILGLGVLAAAGYLLYSSSSSSNNDDKESSSKDTEVKSDRDILVKKEKQKSTVTENSNLTKSEGSEVEISDEIGLEAMKSEDEPEESIDKEVVISSLKHLKSAVDDAFQLIMEKVSENEDNKSREEMAALLVPCLKPIKQVKQRLSKEFQIGESELNDYITKMSADKEINDLNSYVEAQLDLIKETFRGAVQNCDQN